MKRTICLILALCLFLTACGAQPAQPAETTEAPTTVPTEAPTEPEVIYTPYTLGENEVYEEVIQALGFCDVAPSLYEAHEALFERTVSCEIMNLALTENGFRMELETVDDSNPNNIYGTAGNWVLYGTKAEGLAEITEHSLDTWQYYAESDEQKQFWPEDGHCQFMDYSYYNVDPDTKNETSRAYIYAIYFPQTGNLYNLTREYHGTNGNATNFIPWIFPDTDWDTIPYEADVYTVQHDEYEIEMSKFALRWGNQWKIYEYRIGMSLMGWACSELNTDGWIPWYDNTVRSPDGKYIVSLDSVHYPELDKVVVEISEHAQGNCINAMPYAQWLSANMGATDWDGLGVIPFPMAYTINPYTPLITEGFRAMSKMDGRTWYHMNELNIFFIVDDVIDVYMNNISDEVLPHIKMYAFPEPQELLDALGGKSIMDADQQALHLGADWIKIPENAVCMTFQRCSDGKDAPNSPFPYSPGHGMNPNSNAVYARYKVAMDPNFDPDAGMTNPHFVDQAMALAITYDDEIVYWIHLGSRSFHKNPDDFQRIVYAARY